MNVEQIYSITNSIAKEVLGETAVVEEDLSNIVDLGVQIQNTASMDKYVKSLIDHIGKVIFVDRPYKGSAPSVLMDSWDYGSILEKITMDSYPEATENDTWELQDGHSYDPNVFTAPKASAKFFNNKSTFEIPMSFAERQVKSAFDSVSQLNSFFSMIESAIENSMTIRVDGLVMRTINNFMAQVIDKNNSNRTVHLLTQYNAKFGTTLTADKALVTPEFVRWASFQMGMYENRMKKLSKLFNEGGKERFTPADKLNIILLDEFAQAANVYLQSDVYHNEFTKLPQADVVPYWQGSGLSYALEDTSSINVKHGEVTVEKKYIIGVMFDHDALGVSCLDRRVTSNYNPRGEFYNNWYKFDAGYFNDLNENFVVFMID